jgi:hypothetical protein
MSQPGPWTPTGAEKSPGAGQGRKPVPRTSELRFMTDAKVKTKRKRTAAEKAAKKRRRLEYMYVFMNGKQKRIKRPLTVEGMDPDEFIRQNADPVWLHQNEMWEYIGPFEGHNTEFTPSSPTSNK